MFKEIPKNNYSSAKRKPVLGVGINDADYKTIYEEEGNKYRCPFYVKWKDMLRRCYSEKVHKNRPTYKGCTVCEEWVIFSNFKRWMEQQEWEGNHLDKDLKVKGNKVYSPDHCLFVSPLVNGLIHENKKTRGKYPLGVSFHKATNKFVVNISLNGSSEYLGVFHCVSDAEIAYLKRKSEIVSSILPGQKNDLVKFALVEKIKEYELKLEKLKNGK